MSEHPSKRPAEHQAEAKPICEVTDLNLVYHLRSHHPQTARDLFLQTLRTLLKDPISILLREPDRSHILKDINLKITRGDRIALFGINGAGKSSFCRLLGGVMRPSSGTVKIAGQTRAIFQNPLVLHPELTGFENAELLAGLMYPELSDAVCRQLTKSVMKFAELGAAAFAPYRTYSTGMQVRLILSLVTAKPADLLILDEVFDGADIFWQEKIAFRTRDIIDRSGAMLFVSHNLELARSLCRESAVLHQGRMTRFSNVQDGIDFYRRLPQEARA